MTNGELLALLVRVEGGEASAAELTTVSNALGRVEKSSVSMRKEASNPIEHAGIYLFSRQLLDTIGLGQLAQHSFAAINIAMQGLIETFGLTAAVVAPVLLAIGAGITVFELYEKSTKKAAEATAKLTAKQREQLDSTIALNEEIKKTADELGGLPAKYKLAADAARDLQQLQAGDARKTEQEQIDANNKIIQSNLKKIDALQEGINYAKAELSAGQEYASLASGNAALIEKNTQAIKDNATANKELHDKNVLLAGDASAQAHGNKGLQDELGKTAEAHKKAGHAAEKHGKDEKKAAEEGYAAWKKFSTENLKAPEDDGLVKKTEQLNDEVAESTRNSYEKRQAAAKKFYDDTNREIEKMYRDELIAGDGTDKTFIQANERKNAAIAANDKLYAKKQQENLNEMQAAWKHFGDQVTSEVSTSAARIIVENANAAQEVKNLSRSAAEQLISGYIKAGIQHTVESVKKLSEDKTTEAAAVAGAHATAATQIAAVHTVAAAKAAASAAAVTGIGAETGAVASLTAALTVATKAALALDAALAATP